MAACQQLTSRPGGTQGLTSWMGSDGSMSATHIKARRHTETHSLDGIRWQHVNKSHQGQEAHRNSLAGWDQMAACEQLTSRPGRTQQLTSWMGSDGSMSATHIKARR